MRALGCCFGMAAVLLAACACAAAAAPAEVASCAKCHGDTGVSKDGQVPTIAGMSAPYLEAQMSAYQKGRRPCPKMSGTDMCEVAKKLNAGEVKSTAAYYASQKFVAAPQKTDGALAAKGKLLHDTRCAVCHSSGGAEPADDTGILAGQWEAYLQATLGDYVAGKRVAPDAMKRQITGLSADNLNALAEFYASEGSK